MVRYFLTRNHFIELRHKVVICQTIARKLIATKRAATLRYVCDNDVAQKVVYYVVKYKRLVRGWIARKPAFPLSHPPTNTLGQELGSTLRGANMTQRYDQALAQAGENRGELKNVLQQASDLGRQTISLLWQYSIFTKPIQGGENETQQKELIMSLIRSCSYLLTGQRFSGKDPSDRQPINATISRGFKDGYTGRSIKDFEKGNLKHRVTEAVLKLYDDLEVERQVIGPVRRCLEVIHKRIMDDANKGERWELVRKLILKNITPTQFSSDLRLYQRVGLVESYCKQSIVETSEFQETKEIMD